MLEDGDVSVDELIIVLNHHDVFIYNRVYIYMSSFYSIVAKENNIGD